MKCLFFIFIFINILFAENQYTMETVKIKGNIMLDFNDKPINGILKRISKYPEKGTIVINKYEYGLLNGISKLYYPDEKIRLIMNYVDGLIEGESEYYDEKGKLRTTNTYKKDKKNGLSKIYNDDTTYYINYIDNIPMNGFYIVNKTNQKVILTEYELKQNFQY